MTTGESPETDSLDTRPPTAHMWEQVGLGGANIQVRFRTPNAAQLAVTYLMSHGHGHHFAVVGEGVVVIMSRMASQCLQAKYGPTAQPDEAHGYDPDGV